MTPELSTVRLLLTFLSDYAVVNLGRITNGVQDEKRQVLGTIKDGQGFTNKDSRPSAKPILTLMCYAMRY